MDSAYFCPHCAANLNPHSKIILRAEFDGKKGLLMLSPEPGDYDLVSPEGLTLRNKGLVALACPVCGHDLSSIRDPSMAELRFRFRDSQGTVAFSRVYGKHATYFITETAVESFGEDADTDGMNFWGEGPGG